MSGALMLALPIGVTLGLLVAVYLRHRRAPVRNIVWLTPLAGGLLAGFVWLALCPDEAPADATPGSNLTSSDDLHLAVSSSQLRPIVTPLIKVGTRSTVVSRTFTFAPAVVFDPVSDADPRLEPPPQRIRNDRIQF